MDPLLPDEPGSKVARCAEEVYKTWEQTAEGRSTQLVFCDLSTPKADGSFNVYDDLRGKLMAMGIPEAEIAYIHSAKTDAQKEALFDRVREGEVRVLIGSTFKMGAGTNVQRRLIRVHHLDCPWRPADLEQRNGRIVRQGNLNPEVEITTYVTQNTFDAYLYQLVESKQKFISQIMTSKSPVRSAADVDESVLSYAEIKALATGNPHIKEKMDLDIAVSRLQLLKSNHLSVRYTLEDKISKEYPAAIQQARNNIRDLEADVTYLAENSAPVNPDESKFPGMTLQGMLFEDKKTAGIKLLSICKSKASPDAEMIGTYRGFSMSLWFSSTAQCFVLDLRHEASCQVTLGIDELGNLTRIDNALDALPKQLESWRLTLAMVEKQLADAKEQVQRPFPQEQELAEKQERLARLNALLNLDKKDHDYLDAAPEEEETAPVRRKVERGR